MEMTLAQIAAIYAKAMQIGADPIAYQLKAVPTVGCDGAVALPWCNMWLCIERDGYTHS